MADAAGSTVSMRFNQASAIGAAGTHLIVDVPDGLQVSFSPAGLRSIVYKLLSNTSNYRDPEHPFVVQLCAERQPANVVFTVRGNGLGSTATQQSRLFGFFQRLHTHVEGTRVGLYITKRLVKNGGGTIAVQSEAGIGTTFTVTFSA